MQATRRLFTPARTTRHLTALKPIRGANLFRSFASAANVIDYKALKIETTKNPKTIPPKETLVFGREFTDHMLEVDWTKGKGWGTPQITPYHNFSLDPSSMVLHYALECFEGMKAYTDKDGNVRLFRPEKNWARLARSSQRLGLPDFDEQGFLHCLKELVRHDKRWIPSGHGYSLYIRPTVIGTQASLGVGASSTAKLFVIMSPVGPYYPEGWKAVKLLADERYVRAWPGGSGSSKLGSNYAPGILPQMEAAKKGYSQILWLFGPDQNITEVGTMNFFLYWINEQGEKELVTPPLGDLILPGVTRESVLELARSWGEFKVTERELTMGDLIKALKENRVAEVFGTGTAAVVSPVQTIHFRGTDYQIPLDPKDKEASIGPLAKRVADTVMGIQYGEIPHKWSVTL